jgi:hypothetical protein
MYHEGMRTFFLMTTLVASACSDDASSVDAGARDDAGLADASDDASSDGGEPTGHEVLFVGNSYVFTNDVSGRYRTIAEAIAPPVRVEVVAPGGYTWAQHAADARTDGTELARLLRTGTPEETAFDAMILQEQSQIGAFPAADPGRTMSVGAAVELAALARARDADVVLYVTWGRRDGDELNPILFPTFEAMQDLLDAGYSSLARYLAAQGTRVRLAPVGAGFRAVFDDVAASGADPLEAGSAFHALYEADGSHPSPRGAYLAACILAGAVFEIDPASFPDDAALGADASAGLREPCARALADPRWRVPIDATAETTIEVAGLTRIAELGYSIAMSADGTRILAGAPNDEAAAGNARVFVRDGERFVEEAILVPGGPRMRAQFGGSVAMSADGSRAIVGAYVADSNRGSAHVFARTGTSWGEEAVLTDPTPGEFEYFGQSVAMSADGTRVAIAVPNDRLEETSLGSLTARIYVRSGGSWIEEAALGEDDPIPESRAFSVLALSGDGARALVGGLSSDLAPRIFARTGSEWAEEAALPIDAIESAALDFDGSVALVSAGTSRDVRAFRRTGTTWTEEAIVTTGDPRGFSQSVALALSRDGSRAIVGRLNTETAGGVAAGRAETFLREATTWTSSSTLASSTGAGGDRFGTSVAMSDDGALAAIGVPGASGGTIHVFRLR